jgi:hypothetical protein
LAVSLQSNFPFFYFSQQHVFTSLLVRVQTIFCGAADTEAATANAANNGSHFVTDFINFTSFTSSDLFNVIILPLFSSPCRSSSAGFDRRLCPAQRPWSL